MKELKLRWSKRQNDFLISYPSRNDGWEMHELIRSEAFKDFKEILEKRGYDFKTLKIIVKGEI